MSQTEDAQQNMISEILTYDGWDEVGDFIMCFYDAVFVKDFGVFKEGESCVCININFFTGYMDNEGEGLEEQEKKTIKQQKFSLTPE